MRLAESIRSRATIVGLAATLATCAIAVTEYASRSLTEGAGPLVELHVKLRPNAALVGIAGATPPVALFTHTEGDRARWVQLQVPATRAGEIVETLVRDPDIEHAFVVPETSLPTVGPTVDVTLELALIDDLADDPSCPITTPSFESYQGYVGAAPHGIDAPAAWRRGIRGQGVWFADIEGGWNAKHEDLPGDRITHAGGRMIDDPGWRAHGTAVLGEVVGRNNALGVVGLAPDVDRVFTSSLGGTSVANAIDVAAQRLRPGDVLLIELQSSGPRGRWIPVEYWHDVYEVIADATARGIVVIEAAGNGGENLDHRAYEGRFDRRKRDSGAILVGAGGPPRPGFTDRARLDFSNFGGRVDVQGWGRKVATLDYGDLQACDDAAAGAAADRHYTNEFSGTSSASPIVAGAAILVESAARARGRVLAPRELRELLRATGTPQVDGEREHIGPRPDLSRALRAL